MTITSGQALGVYKKKESRGKTDGINNKKRETLNPAKVNYHPAWQDRKFGALLQDD